MVQLYINDTVYELQSARRKHICRRCVSTAITEAHPSGSWISKAEAYRAQLYSTKKKNRAKALPDDTAVSTRAVYKPRTAKRKSIWHNGTARYINRDRPGESMSGATLYKQRPETKAKALLDDTAATTRCQPQSAKRKPIWHSSMMKSAVHQPRKYIRRSCVSTTVITEDPSGNCYKQSASISGAAVYHKSDQINQSESTSGRHSRVDHSGV